MVTIVLPEESVPKFKWVGTVKTLITTTTYSMQVPIEYNRIKIK